MSGVKGRSGGTNRKSRALHVVQGTFRPARHTVDAPEPPAGAPEAPGTLTGEAAAEWGRMLARLTASKTLATVDGALLWNYVQLWADCRRLEEDAAALPRTWFEKTSVDGAGVEHREPKMHPIFAQLKAYRLALRVLLVEFACTPLSRNRVKASGSGAAPAAMDPKKARYFDGLTQK
ncbi:MAG TPA: P27 family phage terminase small subunit [Gemmatimonadaceae bacterium]|nr:P27 family phage terminase small subunit [Gemmatimonadaceae bacterium]